MQEEGGGIILSLSSHSLSQLFCALLVPYFHFYVYFLLQTSRKFSPKKDESPLILSPSSTRLRAEDAALGFLKDLSFLISGSVNVIDV